MPDFIELVDLAYYGSPLIFGVVAGLGFGVLASKISTRRAFLWGLVVGLVGVAVTTVILQFYGYWNDNLRGSSYEHSNLDDFMISIWPLMEYVPLLIGALTAGVTIDILLYLTGGFVSERDITTIE